MFLEASAIKRDLGFTLMDYTLLYSMKKIGNTSISFSFTYF
jgi:hypothetical protein